MAYHRGGGVEASAATRSGAAAARVRLGLEAEARERCYIAGLGFVCGSGPRVVCGLGLFTAVRSLALQIGPLSGISAYWADPFRSAHC